MKGTVKKTLTLEFSNSGEVENLYYGAGALLEGRLPLPHEKNQVEIFKDALLEYLNYDK